MTFASRLQKVLNEGSALKRIDVGKLNAEPDNTLIFAHNRNRIKKGSLIKNIKGKVYKVIKVYWGYGRGGASFGNKQVIRIVAVNNNGVEFTIDKDEFEFWSLV